MCSKTSFFLCNWDAGAEALARMSRGNPTPGLRIGLIKKNSKGSENDVAKLAFPREMVVATGNGFRCWCSLASEDFQEMEQIASELDGEGLASFYPYYNKSKKLL